MSERRVSGLTDIENPMNVRVGGNAAAFTFVERPRLKSQLIKDQNLLVVHELEKEPYLYYFFIFVGLISSQHLTEKGNILHQWSKISFPFSHVVLYLSGFYYLQLLIVNLIVGDMQNINATLIYIYCYFCAMTQCFVLIPASLMLYERLEKRKVSIAESGHLLQQKKLFYYFLTSISVLFTMYPIISIATDYLSSFVPPVTVEIYLYYPFIIFINLNNCVFLAASLMVYAADAAISRDLLLEQINAATQKFIDIEDFKHMKTLIVKLHADNEFLYFAIALMARLNIVAFILRIYIDYQDWQSVIAAFAIYFKEVPFVILMTYYAVEVNELASHLLIILSQQESNFSNEKTIDLMKIVMMELTQPVSVKIMNHRWRKNDLFLETIVLIVTIGIGVIRVLYHSALMN